MKMKTNGIYSPHLVETIANAKDAKKTLDSLLDMIDEAQNANVTFIKYDELYNFCINSKLFIEWLYIHDDSELHDYKRRLLLKIETSKSQDDEFRDDDFSKKYYDKFEFFIVSTDKPLFNHYPQLNDS